MSVIRVCFLGTPDFAKVHLQSLLKDPHFEVVGVVTQPDRPAGRKMQLTPSPVKILALEHHLPVLTPENLRKEPEVLEHIKSWNAEVAVVVAFGQILPQTFLDSFLYGAVNVHGSLLPKWRGAAPIQRSLQAGDTVTGVSLQRMVQKLDAGPVIGERKIDVDIHMNATELYDRMAVLGCELLNVEFMDYLRGHLVPKEQDETLVTLAPKILKDESLLDFKQSAKDLHNKVRAFSMGPGTYVIFQEKRLKIHKTDIGFKSNKSAGKIAHVESDQLSIATNDQDLILLEVQPESKPKMKISDFLKTTHLKTGDAFE